jgi:DNA-directed RNA polymerase II subunit RPB1
VDAVKKIQDLCGRLVVVAGQDGLSREAQRNATTMFFAHMREHLASKRLLRVGLLG